MTAAFDVSRRRDTRAGSGVGGHPRNASRLDPRTPWPSASIADGFPAILPNEKGGLTK